MIDAYPYSAITQILQKGEENAIPAGTIANSLGLPDTRTLRLYIENMRKEMCICSSEKGYYLPKDKDEAVRWKKHMLCFMGKYAALAKSADKFIGA